MMSTTAINAYNKIDIESGVNAADPHKLILMLYQGALLATISAKNQILRKETAAKGASISKAITIIDGGLKASLDMKTGGELAQNLFSLYDYMNQRLLHANLKNDTGILDEVNQLLTDLKGAWESIRSEVSTALPATTTIGQRNVIPAVKSQAFIVQATTTAPQSAIGRHAMSTYGSV
ncbi:Flagellar biosynthesis protein fliS [Candidatus Nitrotoga sp. BS]|uniref:flagellar export chaperone FliS n=1 Tax=Candidatus Nitrotoga sp. BS TaxID=2890408 RepID=UPI001F993447|nr:flagellar export chaperone FliS [Candidatus Nitrotoga sp. BS]CAH1195951.1 Flagellar biosynthesis protein fliS [Candidatus Nitrotoga sp. BS]